MLPLPGKVSEVSVLANPVVPRAAPTPCLRLSSAQHRWRGWELLAPGALGCAELMLLRLEGATWRFSITASLFPLPAQGARLRVIRLDDAGGFLIPVLMGCWRCQAQALHWCPRLAVALRWLFLGSEGLRPWGAVKAVATLALPLRRWARDEPHPDQISHHLIYTQGQCKSGSLLWGMRWPVLPMAALLSTCCHPLCLGLGSPSQLLHCHPPGSPSLLELLLHVSIFPTVFHVDWPSSIQLTIH